ncbi:hypothetical protein QOZ80_6AG0545400 [Eleusine coracana subsp. coracana]|nr:hypothetical protein QOZ80_6AG0545400 [Eleusine coracana subsp. coracana]
MSDRKYPIKLHDATWHPPTFSPDDVAEIPWVLLERQAYVADRINATTAYTRSRCGNQVQVTFVAARPPRASHLCVFCHADDDMIAIEPEAIVADGGDLVLLRIAVSLEKDIFSDADLYLYRPADLYL